MVLVTSTQTCVPLKNCFVNVKNLSCPAVSLITLLIATGLHIYMIFTHHTRSLTFVPLTAMIISVKSIPEGTNDSYYGR